MTPPKRRIRFVWNYLDWGGANVHLLAIMKEATGEWDMEVLLPVGSSSDILDMITSVGVRYRFIDACLDPDPAPTLRRKLKRQWRRIRTDVITYRELRKESLQNLIVHCELAPWQSWIFYWLLCRNGARAFVTMHNALPMQPRWREFLWRQRLRFLSGTRGFGIFPSNHHAKNSLRGWVDPTFWDAMPVTHTCVNLTEISEALSSPFDRDATRERYGIPAGAFVVLTVGQFIDRKGRWTLLDAAKKVVAENPNIHFLWVTPELPIGPDAKRIERCGLGKRFQLIRSRAIGERADVLRFFRIADAFALPSFVEGLPIALLEAMAIGLPSISTNVYGIPEAITDGETGLLIKAGNAEQLVAKITELSHDAQLRGRLAKNGSEFVLSHFDERVAARTALAAYQKALDE